MYFLYSFVLTIAFLLLSPRFLWDAVRHGKYAAGFWQRLGYLPDFDSQNKKIIWLHCVSVGETNAAKSLVQAVLDNFPDYRFVVSTTTKTGQALAQTIFRDQAALVFYFPFDWAFVVRRVLRHLKPSAVLIMETELWFNFLREARRQNVEIALVNGRLSEKSFRNYQLISGFVERALANLDLALMASETDAERIVALGCNKAKVAVTGNVKFDAPVAANQSELTQYFRERFGAGKPFIVAASTHEPEEKLLLSAFKKVRTVCGSGRLDVLTKDRLSNVQPPATANGSDCRLIIVPRHPERFDRVADSIKESGFSLARRSSAAAEIDQQADVILLDSIGELRAIYPLATIVFVGGSLIPHGGQNMLEPAAAQKAIVTGFYTMNFAAIVKMLLSRNAIIQLAKLDESDFPNALANIFSDLLQNPEKCERLAKNAFELFQDNAGATARTVELLQTARIF